ncbi:MAG: hypothetical protein ACI8V4_000274 [Ilumatobacter sp.]|jgi:hypothetical protein
MTASMIGAIYEESELAELIATSKDRLRRGACGVDIGVGDRDRNQVNEVQRQADHQAARRRCCLFGGCSHDHGEEHCGQNHFGEEFSVRCVAAGRKLPLAIRGEDACAYANFLTVLA